MIKDGNPEKHCTEIPRPEERSLYHLNLSFQLNRTVQIIIQPVMERNRPLSNGFLMYEFIITKREK